MACPGNVAAGSLAPDLRGRLLLFASMEADGTGVARDGAGVLLLVVVMTRQGVVLWG